MKSQHTRQTPDTPEFKLFTTNVLVKFDLAPPFPQQQLTLESWYTNKEPLNQRQQLPAPYKRLIHDFKQNE